MHTFSHKQRKFGIFWNRWPKLNHKGTVLKIFSKICYFTVVGDYNVTTIHSKGLFFQLLSLQQDQLRLYNRVLLTDVRTVCANPAVSREGNEESEK